MSKVITGRCQCGRVRYEVRGKLRDVIACHCVQCRRTSGHFAAATACRRQAFTLVKGETLKWYVAVSGFRRGFCSECGSSLFFEKEGGERVSIAAGSLDEPQGLKIAAHIFASEAGDYYEIDASVPVSQRDKHNVALP
jgi:hypothetical protein